MNEHVLSTLHLPSRYEPLVEKIGAEVVRLLVPPASSTLHVIEEAAEAIISLGEGIFLPIHADPGTGKTTLADNLGMFLPLKFTATLTFVGEVSAVELARSLEHFIESMPANEKRVIPINIDHREGRPPTAEENTQIKRFLRQGIGRRALAIWPETSSEIASSMADSYRKVAGIVPLDIPIQVSGPDRSMWSHLASQTLQLANRVDSLEYIVDLEAYDPNAFASIGDYLRQINLDFNRKKLELARSTVRPVSLTIAFVSASSAHGILSSLTSSSRFGMLEPGALLQACSESVIGKWWAGHRGLLVQSIVSLDAHVFGVAPPLSVAVMRRYGPPSIQEALKEIGVSPRTPGDVQTYLQRSDLGRHLAGEARSVAETRGNPAADAKAALELFTSEFGFQGGRDKLVNAAFAEAIRVALPAIGDGDSVDDVRSEKTLGFLPSLIPDVSVITARAAHCVEFAYRKGEYLESRNRSDVAQYCLQKLRNYARKIGWISADM